MFSAGFHFLLRRIALASLAFAGLSCLRAEPIISEFMAANSATLADEDGAHPDWIEIFNPDALSVNLANWSLTDNASRKTKWTFPAVTIPAQGYLIVFASGKDRRDPAKPLHTNFSLDAGGEYLALVRPDGVTCATEFSPGFPAQTTDVAFGLPRAGAGAAGEMTFLPRATPGAANVAAASSVVTASVQFSQLPGPFAAPFTLTLGGANSGEHIRYIAIPATHRGALDVRDPTAASPEYTGPLLVSESVIIRAAVFSADDASHGPASAVHYFRIATSGAERIDTFTSSLPLVVLDTHGYGALEDYDPETPGWMHLFASANGASTLASQPLFSSAAELIVRGNSSALFPKKGYNLDLLDDDGSANKTTLLDLSREDNWTVVAPWKYDRTMLRSAFMYALSNRLGRWAPRTRFVELFMNGDGTLDASDYSGLGVLTEKIKIGSDRVDIAELSSNDLGEPAITGGYILKIDVASATEWGFITEHGIPNLDSAVVNVVAPKAEKLPQAQRDYIRGYVQTMENALFAGRVSGWRDRSYLDYVDFDSWVDHHLLQVLSGNIDALAHSDYFHKDRGGKIAAGPLWDFDRALGSSDPRAKSPESWDGGPVGVWDYGWYGVIARDPEFQQAWVDRWQTLRQGALADAALGALADSLAAEIPAEAAARDSARWPDNVSPTGQGIPGEVAQMKTWLQRHSTWIDQQFVATPTLASNGATLTFLPPAGAALAYTLDGSDPRALGGEVAANAIVTTSALTVAATANVHVRSYQAARQNVFPGSPWSSAVASAAASPLAPKSRLINLSSRGVAGAGENALIVGVVVADTAAKRYLSRGVGPTLATFGATGLIADPQLSIFAQDGTEIYRNNGWSKASNASDLPQLSRAVGAFPLASGSADAALATPFASGAFTLQVTSPSSRPGVALAELYELDSNGRTANLSTRAYVGTGGDVLIGGFVVQGTAHKRMLVRAVGPTLGAFGLSNALTDPVLTLYSGQTVVATNDRWGAGENPSAVSTASRSVGAFALAAGSEDAALIITVPPGAYTVEVRGKNGGQGVALLEIYELP